MKMAWGRRLGAACVAGLLLAGLAGCGGAPVEALSSPEARSASASLLAASNPTQADIDRVLELLEAQGLGPEGAGGPPEDSPRLRRPITADFLHWACGEIAADFAARLAAALEAEPFREEIFYELFGISLLVLNDLFTGIWDYGGNIHRTASARGGQATLAFTGDVNLADDWENMVALAQLPGGIAQAITPPLMARLRAADLLLVNNEFCFSSRGSAMPGKQYTFRAAPANVALLKTMGVDIVSLGNNHVFDYGEEAFADTLDTLAGAGIPYVGAGRNLQEAQLAQYFLVGGLKVAYVAASRAEKHILTPEATAEAPGVLRCYDPALFLEAVEEAAQNADIVVAYPHWGTENSTRLEEAQVELGRALIDAGAHLVVGAHPHVLQGIEFYKGCGVVYSLGNFWFNTDTGDTAFLEVALEGPGQLSLRMVPCRQAGGLTWLLEEEAEVQRVLDYLASLSAGVAVGAEGTLAEKAA